MYDQPPGRDPLSVEGGNVLSVPVFNLFNDYVDLRGPAFESWDRQTLLVDLVCRGLAQAVYFPSRGSPVPPAEVLYKKAVVLAPGSFEHGVVHAEIHERMLASAIQQLRDEFGEKKPVPIGLFCLSASPLNDDDPPVAVSDLLQRIGALLAHGGNVLLFRERELYTMTDLVNRYTQEHVRFVVGLSLLTRVFEDRYSKLEGRLLEALSRLLAQNVRIYAYPMTSKDLQESLQSMTLTGWEWNEKIGWVSADQLRLAPPLGHLYAYVIASKFLIPMRIPEERMVSQ
jgi:hypothetical protein